MYYHVRLDKILHDGRTDLKSRIEWDFRSLTKALTMITREFGSIAECWRIQDLTEQTSDILHLESDLRVALESTYQFIVLTFKNDIPATKKYDHLEFFVVIRDEVERPPKFAYSEEAETALSPVMTDDVFVDLYKHPIAVQQASSCVPVYSNEGSVLSGMAIMLKTGGHFLVLAGENQRNEEFNLGIRGVNKDQIEKILPSTKDGTDLRGFIIRLASGDSLYLTVGKYYHPTGEANNCQTAVDDAKLTAQIRRKRFVKALKTDLNNAMLASGQSVGENEKISIDQNIDRIVFATIWAIVNNKSDEAWREDIWLPLMCLGCPELDMDRFRDLVADNCKKEIASLSSTRL